ncbi:lytic murein transglycosylase [uncultured Devosia sp.]|uniref:lytic murein transglycosylase n=1 Tax=uncultured Devosia sp. TaxID=211434 RepID=UPI0035CB1A43
MTKTIVAVLLSLLLASAARAQPVESFQSFIAGFESKAVAAGVSQNIYRAAMGGLTPDPKMPALVSGQPEFTTPIWDYIEGRVSAGRVARGKAAIERNGQLFAAVGAHYGVDPYILGAIWGIETDFGAVLDDPGLIRPIVRSLATLVHQRRTRLAEDEGDLIAALLLVQQGPLDGQSLVGSWAGAIGHLQVNPSNVLKYGTDGDGDGQVDLQHSLADALATSAVYLRGLGYLPGADWGFEVTVPAGFDYLLASRDSLRPVSFFAERGITRVNGRAFADAGMPVFLYVPAGKDGPKFLMTQNYLVLKGYNFSDSYAMAVAHLADRLKGGGGFVDDWPRQTVFPDLGQRKGIQQALIDLGLYRGAVDGRIGPISQQAYARFQAARGEVADGFITRAAYEDLVAATR